MKVGCQNRVLQDEDQKILGALDKGAESLREFTWHLRELNPKIRNDLDVAGSQTLTKCFVSPMFEQLPVIQEASVDERKEIREEMVYLHGLHESGLSQVKQEG